MAFLKKAWTRRRTMFENPHFFSVINFRTKTYNIGMKIYFEANTDWIFAPKMNA